MELSVNRRYRFAYGGHWGYAPERMGRVLGHRGLDPSILGAYGLSLFILIVLAMDTRAL